MEISTKELAEIIHQKTATQIQNNFWKTGRNYFIRTVTHHHTGVLVSIDEHEIILDKAAWIPDDGRFTQALLTGEFAEVEMFPGPIAIGRGSLIEAVEIDKIPTSQK